MDLFWGKPSMEDSRLPPQGEGFEIQNIQGALLGGGRARDPDVTLETERGLTLLKDETEKGWSPKAVCAWAYVQCACVYVRVC